MPKAKYTKKVTKKPKRVIRRPRRTSVARLSKQITSIKKTMRKETEMKWFISHDATSYTVGQVDANVAGFRAIAFTHNIPSGPTQAERIGRKVQLKGLFFRCTLQQQTNLASNSKYRFELWKSRQYFATTDDFVNQVYDNDGLSGLRDAYSSKNTTERSNHKLVYSKTMYLKLDSYSNVTTLNNYKFFIKQRQTLEYANDATGPEQNVFYYIVLFAYQGNRNTSTASTLPLIQLTAANTGATFTFTAKSYYTD